MKHAFLKAFLCLCLACMIPACCFAERESVFFGTYEQDNDPSNGSEPIEWLILSEEDGYALLLAKYGLEVLPYNHYYEKITWETCTLRKWLNQDFLSTAFSAEELEFIKKSRCTNGLSAINPDYRSHHKRSGGHISTGNDTTDQVFLLSYKELTENLPLEEDRGCPPTAYALAQGAWVTEDSGCGWWWTRSMANWMTTASMVFSGGTTWEYDVCVGKIMVRPAIRLSLNAECFQR